MAARDGRRVVRVALSPAQYEALTSLLRWVDAAGDENEWIDTMTPAERAVAERMFEAVRKAPHPAAKTRDAAIEWPEGSLDALRVIALVRAIEARGAGHPLGRWLEMLLGWDEERAFNAIKFCIDNEWLAPSNTTTDRGRAALKE